MKNNIEVDDNLIAAFLDGRTSIVETIAVLHAAKQDKELREYLDFARNLDGEDIRLRPLSYFAAASDANGSLCCVKCEQYVMRSLGITCDLDGLIEKAVSEGWLRENGTPLLNIGKLSEDAGLSITRKIEASLEDIVSALNRQHQVIVMVDGGELAQDSALEKIEDETIGEIPDHTVVVLMYDKDSNEVVCYDPMHGVEPINVPVERFLDAWEDSKRYMVTITPDFKQ